MSGAPASGLYHGAVSHTRLSAVRHRLRYRVFSLLINIDEIGAESKRVRLLSHNHFNLFSVHDRDFGDGSGGPLRPYVDAVLSRAGIYLKGGRVSLLCYPRILGYVFNPLSVYFCYCPQEKLKAILCEVTNTFHQRHTYILPVRENDDRIVRQSVEKRFYVSPFMQMDAQYAFRIDPPQDRVRIAIHQTDGGRVLLSAIFSGEWEALTDAALVKAALRYPLMTVKVIVGIHWEALKLWRKGLGLVQRPEPPVAPYTIACESHGQGNQS